jgi:hypothetical protein
MESGDVDAGGRPIALSRIKGTKESLRSAHTSSSSFPLQRRLTASPVLLSRRSRAFDTFEVVL